MNNKFVVLIPIAVIAIILSAVIVRLFVMSDTKTSPFLLIVEPEGNVNVKKGESFAVKGNATPHGGLVFMLKTGDSSRQVFGWNPIEMRVDSPEGEFAQEIKIPDNIEPGDYILNVSLGKLSDTRVVSVIGDVPVISPPVVGNTAPYFVYESNRVSSITANIGQQLTIEVIDEDGDLNGVWNETFPDGIANHTFNLLASSITGDIIINAKDLAGNRAALLIKKGEGIELDKEKPIFYVNGTAQANGASIIFNKRNPQKIEVKDNKSIARIGGRVVDTPKYEYSTKELENLPEGSNKLVAYDAFGNSSSIAFIRDLTPPSISEESPIYMGPDSNKLIVFSDDNGLFEVAGTSVIGKDYELLVDSGNLKPGENRFDAYDLAGNMSTLIIQKSDPLGARIVSPSTSPFIVKSDSVRVTVEVRGGQGLRFLLINNDSTLIEPDSRTASVNFRLQDGSNSLAIFVRDDVNNLKLGSIEVIKDTRPPVISHIDGEIVKERIWMEKRSGDNLHRITIKDDSGIDKVTINGNVVKVETGADKTSIVSISDKNLKSDGNEIVILDKVGNELKKSIGVIEIDDPGLMLENIKNLIDAREYKEAEELVGKYEKKAQFDPTVDLLKGIISYAKGQHDKSVEYLNKAYQFRERYDKDSITVEYNILYLGLSYYEQWKSKNNTDSLNKALLNLGRLDNPDVQTKAKEIYEKARNVINSIELTQRGSSR